MAASEPETKPQPVQPSQEAPQPDVAPLEELSEVQAALYALHQTFLSLSQEFQAEQKVLAIMARKSPEEVARELPRRIAGTTVRRLSEAFAAFSQIVAVFADVEERVSALESADDLSAVVGSPEDLHAFLTDVVELCKTFASFAVTEGDKGLLERVRGQAADMLSRMEEEPDEDDEEEPVEAEPTESEPAAEGEDSTDEEGSDAS